MIGTILDITERKAAEAALREAHAVLEARVAQRTAELQQSALQLEAALAEKEVLLKEVHHRVKNNLQVIVSLLRLQSATQADPALRDLFRDSQSRVQAMALVHEQLYQSPDLDRVPFAGYLRRLADTLLRSYLVRTNQVHVVYDLDSTILLALDTAVPLGLIIAELLANSVKHAFPDERTGSIRIALQQTATRLVVSISDDGVGLPNAQNPTHPTSLGLQIVATLIDQLHADIELNRTGGTHYRIAVPLTSGKDTV
jgi:two-component sensor histidine kinase